MKNYKKYNHKCITYEQITISQKNLFSLAVVVALIIAYTSYVFKNTFNI